MEIKLKHVGLIFGLFSFILSHLFFGRQHDTYTFLSIGGFLIFVTSFLFIIFGKEKRQSKFFWIIIVFVGVIIQWSSGTMLRKKSYLIYINSHKIELNKVTQILKNKPEDIYLLGDKITKGDNLLSDNEIIELKNLKEKLNVYTISKSKHGFYFGLWGFLDVRLGITYVKDIQQTNLPYTHLNGNWYH